MNNKDDKDNDQEAAPAATGEVPHQTTTERRNIPSHLRNASAHPCWLRYGVVVFIIITFALVLATHIGSGVTAIIQVTDTETSEIISENEILTVSILSSIPKLWESGSYALAIFICITSISWPYVKLLLTLFAWITPSPLPLCCDKYCSCGCGPCDKSIYRRRERLLEWLDMLGKWSFVDIFVLIIIMVAFRTSTDIGQGYFKSDTYIVPRWGFYGFVAATMLSLSTAHLVLYLHRQVVYNNSNSNDSSERSTGGEEEEEPRHGPTHIGNEIETKEGVDEKKGEDSSMINANNNKTIMGNKNKIFVLFALFCSLVLIVIGSVVNIFEFTYERGGEDDEFNNAAVQFSILSIGSRIPESTPYGSSNFGIRFIQVVYYILAFATPLENIVLMLLLYFCSPLRNTTPRNKAHQKRLIFNLSEITFAWSAVEVMVLSCIFSVLQIPKFAGAMVENPSCANCYTVGATLLPQFAIISVAAVLNFATTLWLFYGAHDALYGCVRQQQPEGEADTVPNEATI